MRGRLGKTIQCAPNIDQAFQMCKRNIPKRIKRVIPRPPYQSTRCHKTIQFYNKTASYFHSNGLSFDGH